MTKAIDERVDELERLVATQTKVIAFLIDRSVLPNTDPRYRTCIQPLMDILQPENQESAPK